MTDEPTLDEGPLAWEVTRADGQVALTFGHPLGERLVPAFLTALGPMEAICLAHALLEEAIGLHPWPW